MTVSTPEGVQTFTHKYKWTLEEISVVTVLAVVSVGSLVWAALNNWSGGFIILAVVTALLGGYAFRLGYKRKAASALTATYDPKTTSLKVDGHVYEGSRNNTRLSAVKTVSEKTLGSSASRKKDEFVARDLLVFVPKDDSEGRPLSVPLRMLSDKNLADLLQPVIDQYGSDKAKAAAEFGKGLSE